MVEEKKVSQKQFALGKEKKVELIQYIRSLDEVSRLLDKDPKTNIYINCIDSESLVKLKEIYPNLLPETESPIFSINVISSRMLTKKGYKKYRYYLNKEKKVLKKFEN